MESVDLVLVGLVLATVEAVKRHVPAITGAKTVALAAVVCLVIVAADQFLPEQYNIVRKVGALFIFAVGGNAYVSQLAQKMGVSRAEAPALDAAGYDPTETPTKPEGRTIPPAKD